MSTPPAGGPASPDPGEEELRAAYEEQLSRITSSEMALQAAVSLLSLGGRRLGLVPGSEAQRDLEQVRDAVDAVRALMPILERRLPQDIAPLRDALSQLQMAYAREAAAAGHASTEDQSSKPGQSAAKGQGSGEDQDAATGQDAGQERGSVEGKGAEQGQAPAVGAEDGATERQGDEPDSGEPPASQSSSNSPPKTEQRPGPAESSGRLWVPGR